MAFSGSTDMAEFLKYVPSDGDLLLSRFTHTVAIIPAMLFASREAVHAVSETYLTDVTWDPVFSFYNEANEPVQHTVSKTHGLTATSGKEVSTEFGLSGTFKGIGFSFGTSSKSFQSVETSDTSTTTTALTLSPKKTTIYYQRLYHFRTRVWFICDAWGEFSIVGGEPRWDGDKNYTVTYSESIHEIRSEDFILTNVAKGGQATFNGRATSPPAPAPPCKWIRQFGNCSRLCWNYLRGLANAGKCNISGYRGVRSADEKEGQGAEYVGQEHPPNKSQDKIVCISKRSSDAPPDEELPAASAENMKLA